MTKMVTNTLLLVFILSLAGAVHANECQPADENLFCSHPTNENPDACYYGNTEMDTEAETVTIEVAYVSGANPENVVIGDTLVLQFDVQGLTFAGEFIEELAIVCAAKGVTTFANPYVDGKMQGGLVELPAREATDAIAGTIPCRETFDKPEYACSTYGCSTTKGPGCSWALLLFSFVAIVRLRRG